MKRRVISFITVLALCLSLCPVRALAADVDKRLTLDKDRTDSATYIVTVSTRIDTKGYCYTISGGTAVRVRGTGTLYLTLGRIESQNGAGIEVETGGGLYIDQAGMTVAGTTYGLDIASGTTVRLSGGTFTGQTAAIHVESGDYRALLASTDDIRYAYFDKDGAPIPLFNADGSQMLSTEMTGEKTVSVKECTSHVYVYEGRHGVTAHGGACKYCGIRIPNALCTFDFDANGHAECAYCEHTLDITINPDKEVYDGTEKPSGDPVTVILDGDILTEGYTVERQSLINVGETVVTVKGVAVEGVEGEVWTYQKTFRVIQEQPVITWDNSAFTGSYDYRVDTDALISRMETDLLSAVKITGEFTERLLTEELIGSLKFSYQKAGDTAFTPGLPTDAGTYTIKASLPETQNYEEASTETGIELTINKIDPIINAPEVLDLTYNGSARELVTRGEVWDGAVVLFATSKNGPWSIDIPTGTNAGNYEVWYKVEGTNNYNGVNPEEPITVTIKRKEITPEVKLSYYTTVYDGGEKQPAVTVIDPEDGAVLPDSEYKVTYENNRYVGKATVTVKDVDDVGAVTNPDTDAPEQTGNYIIRPAAANFQITPADQNSLTITGQPNSVVYGDVFTLGTVGGSGNGTVKWEIVPNKGPAEEENESGQSAQTDDDEEDKGKPVSAVATIDPASGQVTVTGVGTVTVRATKSGTDSDGEKHEDAIAEWTFTAEPKRVTAKVTAASKTYDGNANTTVKAVVEQGVVSGDTIMITGPDGAELLTGTFRDGAVDGDGANAGMGKIVDVGKTGAEITIPKDSSGNEKYIVTIPSTTTADIYRAVTTVTAPAKAKPTYTGTEQTLLSSAAAASFTTNVTSAETLTVEYALSKDGPYYTDYKLIKAVNAGDYEVWYRVKESSNYLGTAPEKIVVTIASKSVTASNSNVTLTPATYVYDGSEKRPAVTIRDVDRNVDIPATEYTVTYRNNVNVGTAATVIITDNPGGNYEVSGTVTFSITSAGADLTGTPQANNLTYNGELQDLVTVGTATGGSLEYALANQYDTNETDTPIPDSYTASAPNEQDYKTEIPKGKYAGTYAVYYRVKGDNNHGNSSSTASVVYVTIQPKTVSSPTITLPQDGFTYNGDEQKFDESAITVYDGTTLIDSNEYNITYSNNVNAGTATVHINDNNGGNYNVSGSTTFKIKKATASFTKAPEPKENLTYNGKPQALITAGIPNGGTAVYSLRDINGPYFTELPTGTDAGCSYAVYAKVLGDANHVDSEPQEVKVDGSNGITIAKKPVTNPDVELSSTEFRYDGSERKPTIVVRDDKGNVIPANEYKVTYKGADGTAADTISAGAYSVVIESRDINYTFKFTDAEGESRKYEVTVTINPADQAAITITGTRAQVVYGDRIQLDITGGTGDGTVTWDVKSDKSSSGDELTSRIRISAGGLLTVNDVTENGESFTVTATRTPTNTNYNTATAKWTFTVSKRTVTAVLTGNNKTYDGNKKATVKAEVTSGLVSGDKIIINDLDGEFVSENVGTNKTVNITTTNLTFDNQSVNADKYDISCPPIATADITPKQVDNPTVMTGQDLSSTIFKYNGSPHKPTVTSVKDGDKEIDSKEYNVFYSDNINAGTATVTVKNVEGGNYTINWSGTFEIQKADQVSFAIDSSKIPGSIQYGDTFTLSTTGGSGDGKITWSVSEGANIATIDPDSGLVTVKGVGEFTVTATKAASTDGNYKEASCTPQSLTAGKKPITVTVTAVNRPYNKEKEVELNFKWDPNDLVNSSDKINTGGVKGTIDTPDAGDRNVTISGEITDTKYEVTILNKTTTVTIERAQAEVQTKPEATANPIYIGSGVSLISEGIPKDGIGVVRYYLENIYSSSTSGTHIDVLDYDDEGPPDSCYVTDVPTTDGITVAATYKVWYKILPDQNWLGTDAKYVEVIIREEQNTGSADRTTPGSTPSQTPSTGTPSAGTPSASTPSTPSTPEPEKPEEPVRPDETEKPDTPDEPVEETASVQTTVRDGAASTVVNGAAGDKLVDEAVANQSEAVVIKPEIDGDVTRAEVSIPASAVGRLGSETDAALTVSTPVANVTIPNAALEALSGAGGDVSVAAERVENTVVLTLTAAGKEIGDIPGGLTLTVAVEDAGPGTVAVLVYEDGTRETIRWSVAEDGALRIPLDGSATVEIVDNSREFADVPEENWAADAVAFASAHELFNGTGRSTFSPGLLMSRGMLATVLYNLEGKPELEQAFEFSDVDSDVWYAAGISWAAANGIVSGYGSGLFGPDDGITREQLAVMLWRYMGKPAASIQALDFADADQVSGYAMEALCWAVENGILRGYGNGYLIPGGPATRAEAAQMLKNFIENA